MKSLCLLFGTLLLCGLYAAANAAPTLVPAWQTKTGLAHPESVVMDPYHHVLYVSNINGNANALDGNGYIAKLTLDGKIIKSHWVSGLNGPKGLALFGHTLYVADINQLVAINVDSGKIIHRYPATHAKFLNDTTVDKQGHVYVSGMLTNTIYRLANNQFKVWIQNNKLASPNGVLAQGQKLIIGSWGPGIGKNFSTKKPGHLLIADLKTKKLQDLGNGSAIGNIDGVEADGHGNFYVTDWMAGKLMLVSRSGHSQTLMELHQGSADLTVIPSRHLVIIPMMLNNQLLAFHIR